MAKKMWMTLGVMGIAVVLGLGVYHSNASQAEPTLSFDDIEALVTSQYPGTITEWELDKDATDTIYYVEIMNEGIEYELKIDGHSGEIIKLKEKRVAAKERAGTKEIIDLKEKEQEQEKLAKEKEEKAAKKQAEKEQEEKEQAEKEAEEKAEQERVEQEKQESQDTAIAKKETVETQDNQAKQSKPQKKEKEEKNAVIDVNKAIDIALAQFPGVVEEAELDEEDGRLIYEIEIKADGEEAEFEIDAYTGEIIVIEIEDD